MAGEKIILYGSRYASTRRYAQALSEKTGIPAVRYQDAPELSGMETLIYLGALYAGGVLGLSKTLRHVSLREGQRLILITVGLADPDKPENRQNIRTALQRQLPAELLSRAEIAHLRGGVDYAKLSIVHRLMMAALYRSIRHIPAEKQTEENRALMETYGKRVDFTDLRPLEPIIQKIQGSEAENRVENG